ncbi:MAG: DEAD/DEAH box helicase family protein, partial [Acholeplasmataceae bacterium]|nr:DEAD/DEAH box helicase family protein [Acholeplasmataceae bacterium]
MADVYSLDLNDKKIINILNSFFGLHHNPKSDSIEYKTHFQHNKGNFYELLNYQFIAKEQIISILDTNKILPRMILHMPTGTGKTKTAVHTVIHDYVFNKQGKGIIIWLAHTHELLKQAYKAFENAWNVLGKKDINVHFNDIDSIDTEYSVYFISYQKLISTQKNKTDYFKNIRKNAVAIVADEAHKCLADETRKSIEQLMRMFEFDNNKYLLGLTATPGRQLFNFDENMENQILSEMFEKRIISINPEKIESIRIDESLLITDSIKNIFDNDTKVIHYFQKNRILAKIIREEIEYRESVVEVDKAKLKKSASGDFSRIVLDKISKYSSRNNTIIRRLIKLHNEKVPTILFACSVQHGQYLELIMSLLGISAVGVYGHTSPITRDKIIDGFNNGEFNILINCEVLTTGFDSPRIKCVFITRPTNSIVLYSQMLG